MWMEETLGKRINRERIQHANAVDADVVATACPFCLTMMTEGATSQNLAIDVADVAQMVATSMVDGGRVPLQFPRHDDGEPRLETWPLKRAEPNASSVHPDDPVEPDALLHELRIGPEDLVPIAMPHDAAARANSDHRPVPPEAFAPAEKPGTVAAAKPAGAAAASRLPETITITEEGDAAD
jgi:hypothetical protein